MGVADEAVVGAVAGPPELEGPGADPLPGLGFARVHRRLPRTGSGRCCWSRGSRRASWAPSADSPSVALEDLPAVRHLVRQPGADRDRDRDDDHRRGRDQRLGAADPEQAGAAQAAGGEADADLDQGDDGADRQGDPDHLGPLLFGGWGRQAAGERVAAVRRPREERRAAGPRGEGEELRQAVGGEGEEGEHRHHRDGRAGARGGEVEGEAGERDRRRGERLGGDGARRGGRGEQQGQGHPGQGARSRSSS